MLLGCTCWSFTLRAAHRENAKKGRFYARVGAIYAHVMRRICAHYVVLKNHTISVKGIPH